MIWLLENHPFLFALTVVAGSWVLMQIFFTGIAYALCGAISDSKNHYDASQE